MIDMTHKDVAESEAIEIDGIEFVKVTRCKDCKWWDKVDNIDGVNYGTCERKCTAIRKDAFPNENWFCADGERKEQDDLDWEEPADLEMGYDPYLGCYTDDC